MTFTYAAPVAGVFPSLTDEIRFLIQDTVSSTFSVTDEEIAYLLITYGNQIYISASEAASIIGIKYGKEAAITSKSVGDLSLSTQYAETANWYQKLSDKLRLGKKDNLGSPYFVSTVSQFKLKQFDELVP